MLISFNPSITNKSNINRQNPAFGQINQEWLTKIIRNSDVADNEFSHSVIFSKISIPDAVDTLKAAKKHYFPKLQESFDGLISWASNYKPQ